MAPAQSVAVEPGPIGESTAADLTRICRSASRRPFGPSPDPFHTLSTAKSAMPSGPVDRWVWPAAGAVSRPFSGERHKGIDLAGQRARQSWRRRPVSSSMPARGDGLRRIINTKHNDTYLSAYGHNDELLAVEGEQVEGGQVIARMGSTDADSVKLHFEIRRDGRPVNPTGLLPSR
ncbi:MAG: hypothetical protein CM15mP84_02320 [Cellvibrionales bacterium]|nr:MAG: hypothetical protein CM15mP84_02320 [Cellvibrionales bacterium]